ncbi:MAG: nickel pincer cofactor biosynthesis protein LarC [Verrucomicrobiales bacterium]|nr:nickel pincer cofactor biosynthesis protein LarC [Verrucomicrobiales bacterium]
MLGRDQDLSQEYMKSLYLDIFSGISGDMFIGAMIDLGVASDRLEAELRKLRLQGYQIQITRGTKTNIEGVKFDVHVEAAPEVQGRPLEHDQAGAQTHEDAASHHDHLAGQTQGPHGGLLVETAGGRVELSVFETGVPPRFRLYFFDAHGHATKPPPAKGVQVETRRPAGKRQVFEFKGGPEYLEAIAELPEPHEFHATLKMKRGSKVEKRETEFVEEDHHHTHPGESGRPTDSATNEHTEDLHCRPSRNFAGIRSLIQQSALSDWVKRKAVAVFHRIAVAEGKIHGQTPEEVHFHEVGAIDSIIDIVGACVALELLGQPHVLAAPVVDGTGWVRCAHGRFPVPTMATLSILGARGIAVTQCEEPQELVTPTGAALLAEFVEEFGPMKNLVAEKIGYGLGTRDNQTRPNVLRAVLGEVTSNAPGGLSRNDWETDTIAVLETSLDDCTAEVLGFVLERALAEGALDAFHTPVQMKKNRPGVLLTILCAGSDADKFTEMLLRETSAFGVRRYFAERRKLRREVVTAKTAFGDVTVKLGKLNGKILHVAPEFESCRKLAQERQVSLSEIYEAARHALPKY